MLAGLPLDVIVVAEVNVVMVATVGATDGDGTYSGASHNSWMAGASSTCSCSCWWCSSTDGKRSECRLVLVVALVLTSKFRCRFGHDLRAHLCDER